MKKLSLLFTFYCFFVSASSFAQDSSCNAAFTYTISGSTVKFIPSSGASNNMRRWDFGDGQFSDNGDPQHTYGVPGAYRVLHTIKDTLHNCFDTVSRIIIIPNHDSCQIEPKFSFYSDSFNCKRIHFTNQSTPISPNAHFVWKFGDGTTSSDINATHEYSATGNYQVCLVVESGANCRKEYCKIIEVHCADTCNVHARFESKHDVQLWNKIWFANVSQPVANIRQTYWSYGDGSSSQDFNSFHTYNAPGRYYVCLKVVSLSGCTSTWCDSLTVRRDSSECDHLQVKLEYSPDPQRPNKISFKAVSNQTLTKQKWTIRKDSSINGSSWSVVLTDNNPTFIFPFTGGFRVCLTANTANNCVRESCEHIYIQHVTTDTGRTAPHVFLSPNPTRNNMVQLAVNMDATAPVTVYILSTMGVVEQQMQVSGQRGNNIFNIPVSKLSQGQYLVQLRYGNQVFWTRFQKL